MIPIIIILFHEENTISGRFIRQGAMLLLHSVQKQWKMDCSFTVGSTKCLSG